MNTLGNVLSADKARANFYQILDEVDGKWRQFTITLRGKVKAVVVSADELESWMETIELLSDKKQTNSLRKGVDDANNGRTYSDKEVDKKLNW